VLLTHKWRQQMKALSIKEKDGYFYYLLGVLLGDAIRSNGKFGLCAKDLDFVLEFKKSILRVFKIKKNITKVGGKYYYFCIYSVKLSKFFNEYDYTEVQQKPQKLMGAFLRGFFDSEGNVALSKLHTGTNSFTRDVAVYNTDKKVLILMKNLLERMEIKCRPIHTMRKANSDFHKKTLYRLHLRSNRDNYSKFREKVSFSIKRKRDSLDAIIDSYLDGDYRMISLKNARSIHSKKQKQQRQQHLKRILPILKQKPDIIIREAYAIIPNYHCLLHHYRHKELVSMALRGG